MNDHEPGPAVRPLAQNDLDAIRGVIASTDLFPAELLDGMTAGYLDANTPEEIWLTLDDGEPIAVAYVAPERMTSGTWNLLLIAVHADRQEHGYGTLLMGHIERTVAAQGGRVLLVETSGLAAFERTRAFYTRQGYDEEAHIRDFYDESDDKVSFGNRLGERGTPGLRHEYPDAPDDRRDESAAVTAAQDSGPDQRMADRRVVDIDADKDGASAMRSLPTNAPSTRVLGWR